MSGLSVPAAREYLLSHHAPDRWNRTIPVRLGSRNLHCCARCTGQVLGAIVWLALFLVGGLSGSPLFSIRTQAVLTLFPLLASGDWVSQSMGRRESSNLLRVLSGALLGFALVNALGLLLTGQLSIFLGQALVAGAYLGALLLALWVTGAWRRVLVEHFPGIPLPPSG